MTDDLTTRTVADLREHLRALFLKGSIEMHDAALDELARRAEANAALRELRAELEQSRAYSESRRAEHLLGSGSHEYWNGCAEADATWLRRVDALLAAPQPPAPVHPEAQPPVMFDLVSHLRRQADFSARTFGPGDRTRGVIDHIRKELSEVHAEFEAGRSPLAEWIDVAILAFDGAWRCGASPEQIVQALAAKQAKNEAREWPDWRTMDPNKAIEHKRGDEPPAPAAPIDSDGDGDLPWRPCVTELRHVAIVLKRDSENPNANAVLNLRNAVRLLLDDALAARRGGQS